ncbi:MAG: HEAT repeat protein [Verrucomicrobia bacterium ADurb.Bin006]|nr:MAG: HEAT repeat protein [Verrucomicrobia bacterium ADurb.Bin006]
MLKTRVALIAVGICTVVGAVFVLRLQTAERASQNQTSPSRSGGLNEILEGLTLSLPTVSSTNNRAALAEGLRRRQDAIEKLRADASGYLPQLMEEVYAVGHIEATNQNAAASRTAQLALAFEALGSEARPLLPKLEDEFNAGRSIGPCVAAFQHIGGTDCGLILVSGLTNSDRLIRNAAMSTLSGFATNRDVAIFAVRPLLQLLKDDSEFSRALAASVLGSLQQEPDAVIPDLLQVANNDSNFVVRVSAVKAIGRFGTNAAVVRTDLESIAARDQERSVRRIAEVAVRAANGEIRPDEVQ